MQVSKQSYGFLESGGTPDSGERDPPLASSRQVPAGAIQKADCLCVATLSSLICACCAEL